MLENTKEDTIFASILADGKIHVEVPEGTEGAVKREWESKDGKSKGVKHELLYTKLTGMLDKVGLYHGDYGTSLQIRIVDPTAPAGTKPVVLSLATAQNYGEDMMKKLPNIDQNIPVVLQPYSFEDRKTGKTRRGISITQVNSAGEEVKIKNYYWNEEKKEPCNGIPQPTVKKKMTSDDWKLYFTEIRVWLIDETKKRFNITDPEPDMTDDGFDD